MSIRDEKNCPICNYQLKSDKNIYEELKNHPSYKNWSDEKIKEAASHYGHTDKEPQYFSKLIGIELPYDHPNHYDGVSYWQCPNCKTIWNRFTEKIESIF